MPIKSHTNHKIALSYDESMDVGELNKSISSINDAMLRNVSEAPTKRSILETLLETHKYIESNNAVKDCKLVGDGGSEDEHSVIVEPFDNKLQAIFENSDSNSNVESPIVPFKSLELIELKKLCENPSSRDDIELKIVEEDEVPVTYADILKTPDESDKENSAPEVSDSLIRNDPCLNDAKLCVDNNNSLVDFLSGTNADIDQPKSSIDKRENPILIDAATETSFDINENNSTSTQRESLNCNVDDLIIFDDKLNDEEVFQEETFQPKSTKSSKSVIDLPVEFPTIDDEDAVFVNKMDSTDTNVIKSRITDTPQFDVIVSRSPPLDASTETPPATPQTPISPNLLSSVDTHLFISDSSQSLDSINEVGTSFETKGFHISAAPERSFSSESLNSETSIDSNDSKSSIKLTEAKFSKNGTLERQTNNVIIPPATTTPCGLQVLVLWNNRITREAAKSISDLLATTTTLEILNVGRNVLSNDFLTDVKCSLKSNTSLTSLGLQSAHFTCAGMKTLAEIIEFGGNSTLQRIDLRDNHLQVGGLTMLNDAIKTNKSLTRIDLDDIPRRANVSIFSLCFSKNNAAVFA